ncbi:MAG: S-layer homology domain-containing protein [Vicinamibacterales bacterium]
MRAGAVAVIVVATGLSSACAPRTMPLPVVAAPLYPDFVQPTVPADQAETPAARQSVRAWVFLQSGDLRSARREVAAALKARPGFHPAQATSAYVALADKDVRQAQSLFTTVTEQHPDYVPALVGRGLAYEASGDTADALQAYRAALAVDPARVELTRRVDVLTLRGLQDELAAARRAASEGNAAAALRAYRNAIAASPDSAFLYREVAAVERRQGDLAGAVEHLRRAHDLDPSDPSALTTLAEVLDQQGDLEGALKAYDAALAIDEDPAVVAKRADVRGRMELAALPAEYRAITGLPQVTRADLAALLGVRLADLLRTAPTRDVGVLTDVRGQWAEPWISAVVRAGIIEALPNHTFQPGGLVRRIDLAQAVSRVLNLLGARQPARLTAWTGARGQFPDLPATHLAYPAASMAVAAGVMETREGGAFQPTRPVPGSDAIETVERLRRLASSGLSGASNR